MSSETPEAPGRSAGTESDARQAEAPPGDGAPARTDAAQAAALEGLLTRLVERLGEALAHLARLASVQSERARQRLQRARWQLVQALVLGFAGAALALCGAVYLARGLSGTFAQLLGGRSWLGQLATGLLLLALVAAGLGLARARDERQELERLRRKYGDDRGQDATADRGSEDGGRAPAPGARASAGGPGPEPGRPAG